MNIKRLTGFAVVTAADGKRISYNWTELDADGNTVSKNNLASFAVMDEALLAHIDAVEAAIKGRLEGQAGG